MGNTFNFRTAYIETFVDYHTVTQSIMEDKQILLSFRVYQKNWSYKEEEKTVPTDI